MVRYLPALLAMVVTGCTRQDPSLLCDPVLPRSPQGYTEADSPIPAHFGSSPAGTILFSDNTPSDNRITNAGALLGRVLFYDVRLSANDSLSCASCHRQQFGFADTGRVSRGVHGSQPARRAMALSNARFNAAGRFFWDGRAGSLEAQVLAPLQDAAEMGMALSKIGPKLDSTVYYPALFAAAFGSPEATSERMAAALAQFVRALVSAGSPFDAVFAAGGAPRESALTAEQWAGWQLFQSSGCLNCHRTIALFADQASNIGLDSIPADTGAGQGRFKPASLRNVAVRPPYMHDGRLRTLAEVVRFYNEEVRSSPFLDPRLRAADGTPRRLGLSGEQQSALVAFLEALTDTAFLQAEKFADPFPCRRSR
jgi:cytochrome c peroxidase